MPSKAGTSSGVTPKKPQPVPGTPFKPTKRPKAFHYMDVDEIPRLPGLLTEKEFYDQWVGKARLNGFPLVEEQDFIVGHCYGGGNCYWTATAVMIYGSDQYWPWVKAQHYLWVSQVLENEAHPRYALYRRLLGSILSVKNNERQEVDPPQPPLSPSAFNSMGQPNGWTSTDMTPITADLYGINLVLFLMHPSNNSITDKNKPVLVKGCPNAPSRFLRFMNGNHFEPMRPDVPRPSEFRYPLVNNEATKGYPNVNKKDKPEPHKHPWRTGGQPHGRGGVDEELYPRPVLPLPSEADLAFVIGQEAKEREFSREPGWLPPINSAQVEIARRNVTRIVEGARAVYHSWTEPALLLECTRRQFAPTDNDPTRALLIDALLAHDETVATKLVEEANAVGGVLPPTPPGSGGNTGGVKPTGTGEGSLPTPKSGGVRPPKSGGTQPPPVSSPTPKPKKGYTALRKGDLLAEARSRGLKVTTALTVVKLREILEADDLKKAEDVVVIDEGEEGKEGGRGGRKGAGGTNPKGESPKSPKPEGSKSKDPKPEDPKSEVPKSEDPAPETKDQQPSSTGKDKKRKRPAPAADQGIDNAEEVKRSPKKQKKESKK